MAKRMTPALISLCLFLVASAPTRPETLPAAATLFARYIEATGGRAAWEAIENRVVKATLEIPGEGIRVAMTTYLAQPNLTYSILESETSGRVEKGTDGNVVWELSSQSAPILKEGRVRADFLREATLNKYLDWQELYDEAECVGGEELEGKEVWKLILRPHDAPDQVLYFDRKSSLLVRVDLLLKSLAGDITMEIYLSDYREAGGVILPYRMLMKAQSQERLVVTRSVETNVELPWDRFVPPDEVLAMASP